MDARGRRPRCSKAAGRAAVSVLRAPRQRGPDVRRRRRASDAVNPSFDLGTVPFSNCEIVSENVFTKQISEILKNLL